MKPFVIFIVFGTTLLSGCSHYLEATLKDENRKRLDRGEIDYYEYTKMNETLNQVGDVELY